MDMKAMQEQLKRHEGLRLKPYKCTAGRLSIGYGRNLSDKGISETEAHYLLENDIYDSIKDMMRLFPDHYINLPDVIQRVIIDMRFQLGPNRFRQFEKMISAIHSNNLPGMVREMKDSNWYKQTPNRASELVAMVEGFILK